MPGEHTLAELMSQPEVWAEALSSLGERENDIRALAPRAFDEVVFTGCGSTYYLAQAAASLCQSLTGVSARGLPASELWLYPQASYKAGARTLLIAFSRSGTTTETVRAVRHFKQDGRGSVITLGCYPHAELSVLGDLNLVLEGGQEKSIAQTRAFSVLYLAATVMAHLWADLPTEALVRLPGACRRLLAEHGPLVSRLARDASLDRFYFLGSGPRYGLACELSLKMKEMALAHSQPFHFLEFRHGPQSMATETTLIVGLVSDENGDSERAVLSEMEGRGAQILSLAEQNADIAFGSGLPASLRNALYLPVVQHFACERSLSKGLDPDQPNNLEAVVMLE